jgi:hypothetical protein
MWFPNQKLQFIGIFYENAIVYVADWYNLNNLLDENKNKYHKDVVIGFQP